MSAGASAEAAEDLSRRCSVACIPISCDLEGDRRAKIERNQFLRAFNSIADDVERQLRENPAFSRRRIVVLESDGDGLDIEGDGLKATNYTKWSNLAALLVVCFPELHWLFLLGPAEASRLAAAGFELHAATYTTLPEQLRRLRQLRDAGFEPLFDPTGFRSFVKVRSYNELKWLFRNENGIVQCPRREKLAVVLDDETEVAGAVSYAFYKKGCRVLSITSEGLLRECASRGGPLQEQPAYIAESYTIAFPDSDGSTFLDVPMTRGEQVAFLRQNPGTRRIVYTIDGGRRSMADQPYELLHAPFDGLEGLADTLGLHEVASQFHWPPEHRERGHTLGRHAVPGFLAAAGRRLLARLSTLERAPPYTRSVIALEAQELLLNRIPSQSLIAQQARLGAEVQLEMNLPTVFGRSGGRTKSDLRLRFREIEQECASILSVVMAGSGGRRAQLSRLFQSQLIGVMIDEFRASYHFDEEISCLKRQREIDLNDNPVGWYITAILSSPANFVMACFAWTIAFAFVYALIFLVGHHFAPMRALLTSAYAIVTVGAPPDDLIPGHLGDFAKLGFLLTVTLESIIGLAHWGMGFAHIYTLLSRR